MKPTESGAAGPQLQQTKAEKAGGSSGVQRGRNAEPSSKTLPLSMTKEEVVGVEEAVL